MTQMDTIISLQNANKVLHAQIAKLERALKDSVKLQAHYAEQLNGWDGGKRIVFKSAEEWLERLK